MQILSTIGNLTAGAVSLGITHLVSTGVLDGESYWRWMFLVGAVPALLVVFTMKFLREPEPWLRLKEEGKLPKGAIVAPYLGLLEQKRWRKNLVVGALIASTGVVGLWAIGEYFVDLQSIVFRQYYERQQLPADQIQVSVDNARTIAYVLQQLGAGVGMWIFTRLAISLGRKPAFAIGFLAALVITVFAYWRMNSPWDAYWMMPLVGAAQLSVFAGYAIYLPELFPSRLRSTGTSFCYNLGRFAAAGGSFFSAVLAIDGVWQLRLAAQGTLRRDGHVLDLPRRPGDAAVCTRDEGPAAAGIVGGQPLRMERKHERC